MAELLKNRFFQKPFIRALSQALAMSEPKFSKKGFYASVYDSQWDQEELKQRMTHISRAIHQSFGKDYLSTLGVLRKIAPKFNGFDGMIFPDFVQQFGLEFPEPSLKALEEFTQHSSSEFAVRPFIVKHEALALENIVAWSKHENYHVRRLASEGCRPRLPWAASLPKFKQDPSPVLPILDNLKSDPTAYVRKSVANNLNDISKDHPARALQLVQSWSHDPGPETLWIIKHGLRTLIKDGNRSALEMLGYDSPKVVISNFRVAPNPLTMGGALALRFDLANQRSRPQRLLIDYLIHFVKANGSTAPKVFKWSRLELGPKETISITKHHPIKEITTRNCYPGYSKIEIQINGKYWPRLGSNY